MMREGEKHVWQAAVQDVKPLKARRVVPRAPTADELAKKPIKPKPVFVRRAALRTALDARLDLHGLTEAAAHRALMDFMALQHMRGARRLLVITGKSGALRGLVPRWLDVAPMNGYIAAIEVAPMAMGGAGAYIIRLKKPAE